MRSTSNTTSTKKVAEGAENEAVEQVAFADRLILNKCDVVPDEADLKRIEDRLRSINKFAPILRSTKSLVSVDNVLHIGAFDLQRTLDMDPEFLDTEGEHVHDQTVTSVGIKINESVDLNAIQSWMSSILKTKGADMYRMKGVLSVAHADNRFVFQAVHMLFDGNFMERWQEGEERGCKLTFIGKNINEQELRDGFRSCLFTEEERAKRLKMLRFRIGDAVECNTGKKKWSKGKVIALMYRDDYMDDGMVAPYQVELDNGDLIYAPADENFLIRRASA
jgi:G3E family GTPase